MTAYQPLVGDRVVYNRGGAVAYLGRIGTVIEPRAQSLTSALREVKFDHNGRTAVVIADGLDPLSDRPHEEHR